MDEMEREEKRLKEIAASIPTDGLAFVLLASSRVEGSSLSRNIPRADAIKRLRDIADELEATTPTED